jgi:hypothetical protein
LGRSRDSHRGKKEIVRGAGCRAKKADARTKGRQIHGSGKKYTKFCLQFILFRSRDLEAPADPFRTGNAAYRLCTFPASRARSPPAQVARERVCRRAVSPPPPHHLCDHRTRPPTLPGERCESSPHLPLPPNITRVRHFSIYSSHYYYFTSDLFCMDRLRPFN